MKSIKSILYFLSIISFTGLLLSSCEEEDMEDPGNNQDEKPVISYSRPVLKDGSVSITNYDSYSIVEDYQNPFKAVELNDPTALGLVVAETDGTKKSGSGEGNAHYLYEKAAGKFSMVKGKQGNKIRFRNVKRLERINSDWQIFTREGQFIFLETSELQIDVSVEISVDSVFLSDTVAIASAMDGEYSNIGDTVFVAADTIIYNDTLWIQEVYTFTDTVSTQSDTIEVVKEEAYQALLLNTTTGDLYDIAAEIYNPVGDGSNNYMRDDFFDYDPANNCIYFYLSELELGKVNLSDLTLEIINMPEDPVRLGLSEIGAWCVLENDNVLLPNYKVSCYIPGQGLRTLHNLSDMYPAFQSLNWRGKDNKRYMLTGISQNIFTVELKGDSIIFDEVDITVSSGSTKWGDYNPEFAGQRQSLIHNGERWFYDGSACYCYNEEESALKYFNIQGELMTNGLKSFLVDGTQVYEVSIDQMNANLILDYNTEGLESASISINADNNIILTGFRLYDLKNVVIEYNGETGEKIQEWDESNAPPENMVIQLSPVFND
ncbi:MAG: hypothetical protein ACP5E3_12340 [Bacteroidales bacterium]